jgi:hypothetical protein
VPKLAHDRRRSSAVRATLAQTLPSHVPNKVFDTLIASPGNVMAIRREGVTIIVIVEAGVSFESISHRHQLRVWI